MGDSNPGLVRQHPLYYRDVLGRKVDEVAAASEK